MKSQRCIVFCALMILLVDASSCLITAIISSDAINNAAQPSTNQNDQIQQPFQDKVNHGNADNKNSKSEESSVNLNTEPSVQIENPKETFKENNLKHANDENKVLSIESEKINDKHSSDSIEEIVNQNENEKSSTLQNGARIQSESTDMPNVPESTTLLRDTSDPLHLETTIDDNIKNIFNNNVNNTQTNGLIDSIDVQHHNKNHIAIVEDEFNASVIPNRDVIHLPGLPAEEVAPTRSIEIDSKSTDEEKPHTKNDTIVEGEATASEAINDTQSTEKPIIELNLTVDENQIPVFSEWAEKRLKEAEQETEQEVVNSSVHKKNASTPNKPPVVKLKTAKNYASPDCGAKIIAANSESSGTGYILTSNKDEYLLSPCKSRIWFVVELCETIQAERVELANFELFSSSPKNFSVAVSSRFPTRDWSNVGRFIAKDERYVQNFDLFPHLFGKYVRVDIHSHFNSEHFCPISLFRVYGTSEFEAFETENRQHPIDDIDDDDADDEDTEPKQRSNIFKSASDAVMSIVDTVKKTVAFVKPNDNKTNTSDDADTTQLYSIHNKCVTPNFVISCDKCSKNLTMEAEMLLRCKSQLLNELLNVNLIKNSIYKSQICANLVGLDLNYSCRDQFIKNSGGSSKRQLTELHKDYILHLFPIRYMVAMCNLVAGIERRFSFNTTYPLTTDASTNITIDKKANLIISEKSTKADKEHIESNLNTISGDLETSFKEKNEASAVDTTASQEPIENTSTNKESSEKSVTIETQIEESVKETPEIPANSVEEALLVDEQQQNIFNVVDTPTSDEKDSTEASGNTGPPVSTETANSPLESTEETIILPGTTPVPPNGNDITDATDEQNGGSWSNQPQFGQKFHSDSVFLRLSNRIKALERNMTLSGQYLEELSRRYKKQVEELQLSFAKTLLNIEEQNRRSLERKQELVEQNQKLRDDLEILTDRVFCWKNIFLFCSCFITVQVVIFYTILRLWTRKYFVQNPRCNHSNDTPTIVIKKRKTGNVSEKFRRKSAEEKRESHISSQTALQRRPSTEALNITGTYEELLIKDNDSVSNIGFDHEDYAKYDNSNESKEEKAKLRKQIVTSNEKQPEPVLDDFVRIEDLKQLYTNPPLSDDYEIYGPPDLSSNELVVDDSESAVDSSQDHIERNANKRLNPLASASAKLKFAKNKNKTKHLSSPTFFKFPNSKVANERSTGWEWRSKKSIKSSQNNNSNKVKKKSKSESPVATKCNGFNSNSNSNNSNNNNNCSNNNNSVKPRSSSDSMQNSIASSIDSDRKQGGSFRKLLKKMF